MRSENFHKVDVIAPVKNKLTLKIRFKGFRKIFRYQITRISRLDIYV